MQYLYVLVSSPKDNYYEQFLLSAASFRLAMPDAELVLLCDLKTKENLTGKRAEYQKFVSKIITAEVPGSMPQVEVSRWVKTSMRRLVPGDFLFIDCDTIITEDLSSIAQSGIQFGACLDKHSLLNRHGRGDKIAERDKQLGFNSYMSNRHFNSGIIFCADTPETQRVFDRWHELWSYSNSKNVVRDQPAFNMAIYENASLFTELDGIWNCQISYSGLPFLAHSKIIHYFASDLILHNSPFLLASEEVFKKIKETGVIPGEDLELLKDPRAAFESESRIIAGDDILHVINSSYFEILLWIKHKMPGLFNCMNWFTSVAKKIAKFFLVKSSRKKDGGIKHYN
jgi:hypothetical protein